MLRFTSVHDPLCGWCYGMKPALNALRARHSPAVLEIVTLNAVLWGGTSARLIAEGFRQHRVRSRSG